MSVDAVGWWGKQVLFRLLRKDIFHSVSGRKLILPTFHRLPLDQAKYPAYGRFLTTLSGRLSPDDMVADVGANCGDTLLGMVGRNSQILYCAVEPDPDFFMYLQKSVSNLGDKIRRNIALYDELVGTGVEAVTLSSGYSTKAIFEGEGEFSPKTLDDILSSGGWKEVRVLKSDVDGYDYDVILSASEMFRQSRPICFFECDWEGARQKRGFDKAFQQLQSSNYCHYWFFDNFSNYKFYKAGPISTIDGSVSGAKYVDILCCVDADYDFLSRVVKQYESLGYGV